VCRKFRQGVCVYIKLVLGLSCCKILKYVEESNSILRINNIQCITLIILYGQFMMHGQRNIKLYENIVKYFKKREIMNATDVAEVVVLEKVKSRTTQ